LIDARKGVLVQSRRHAFITALLGIRFVAVAVNKMDLVEFREDVFRKIEAEFLAYAKSVGLKNVAFFPISALEGDNITEPSPRTPWYTGPSLLEHLETVDLVEARNFSDLRFPVQYVNRPTLDFRGYTGQLASGVLRVGQTVMTLPSGRITKVKSLPSYDGELAEAYPPMSVTVCLEDEVDISRGDMLVDPDRVPHVSRRFAAKLVWMHETPGEAERDYLLKHTSQTVRAQIAKIRHRIDINTLAEQPANKLELNEIASIQVETRRPLFFDSYAQNRTTGAFILIDPISNATVAAGMIEESTAESLEPLKLGSLEFSGETEATVTPAERYKRAGHYPATVWLTARQDLAGMLERKLFDLGCSVHVLADDRESHLLPELARVLNSAGLIAICSIASPDVAEAKRAQELAGDTRFLLVDPQQLPVRDEEASEVLMKMLEDRGVLRRKERFEVGEGI
jgi:sulfate adenylyltransferase large subunit